MFNLTLNNNFATVLLFHYNVTFCYGKCNLDPRLSSFFPKQERTRRKAGIETTIFSLTSEVFQERSFL